MHYHVSNLTQFKNRITTGVIPAVCAARIVTRGGSVERPQIHPNRDDKTAIELFTAGVRAMSAELARAVEARSTTSV
jgi:hypothetical protein